MNSRSFPSLKLAWLVLAAFLLLPAAFLQAQVTITPATAVTFTSTQVTDGT